MLLSWNAPRYKSHKVVKAAPIFEYQYLGAASSRVRITVAINGDAIPIDLPIATLSRYVPQPGDYLVEYDDGYVSISPKKAFEDGYTKVEA